MHYQFISLKSVNKYYMHYQFISLKSVNKYYMHYQFNPVIHCIVFSGIQNH